MLEYDKDAATYDLAHTYIRTVPPGLKGSKASLNIGFAFLCRPPPRTSHQAVVLKDWLYVFGGELTSINQANFFLPDAASSHHIMK